MYKIGDRVGAILGQNEDGTISVFGFGIYEGNQLPKDPSVKFLGMSIQEFGHNTPKIKLDSGEEVWGCECWWGSEERIQKILEGYSIEQIKFIAPSEYRASLNTSQE